MTPSPQQHISRQFLAFLVAGGIAAAVNYGSRFLYSMYFEFSIAVLMAFLTGMFTAFILNKLFVFTASKNDTGREIIYFILVNMLGLAQTWLISIYLAEYLLTPAYGKVWGEAISHLAGVAFPVITSFIGHKFLTFKGA
jgi:putative flippase GtrA